MSQGREIKNGVGWWTLYREITLHLQQMKKLAGKQSARQVL
jgi:hypothetical protein